MVYSNRSKENNKNSVAEKGNVNRTVNQTAIPPK